MHPQAAYAHDDACTLLRNPHIARNEELQLSFYDAKEERKQMRHYYFGHLTDVVMVDSNMLAAERLGGADYDGDMIKTISDPILMPASAATTTSTATRNTNPSPTQRTFLC